MNQDEPVENTDKEIWRESPNDYYSDSIHVTKEGGIGINCGGFVIVKPIEKWHALAVADLRKTLKSKRGEKGMAKRNRRKNIVPLGAVVLVKDELIRDLKHVNGKTLKVWEKVSSLKEESYKPVHGIYVGYRTLQNGYTKYGYGDEGNVFKRTGSVTCALVAIAPNKKLLYVPFDEMILVHSGTFNKMESPPLTPTNTPSAPTFKEEAPNMRGGLF